MEKSLLKQALSIGMDEGWIMRLLPGGDPPPWRALSRESSVPLEAWLTESQRANRLTLLDLERIFSLQIGDVLAKKKKKCFHPGSFRCTSATWKND